MQRKIFKTGHSAVITLSKKLMDEAGLTLGDAVEVVAKKGLEEVVVRKSKKGSQLLMPLNVRPKM